MEHVEIKKSLDSKLQILPVCSIRILMFLEVILKHDEISKNRKMRNPDPSPICTKKSSQTSYISSSIKTIKSVYFAL